MRRLFLLPRRPRAQKLQHDPALWSWPSRCLQCFVLHSDAAGAQARSSRCGRTLGICALTPPRLVHAVSRVVAEVAARSGALLLAHALLAVRGAQLAVALVCSLLHRDSGGGCRGGVHRERKDEANGSTTDESGPVAARGGTRCEVGIWTGRQSIVRRRQIVQSKTCFKAVTVLIRTSSGLQILLTTSQHQQRYSRQMGCVPVPLSAFVLHGFGVGFV